MGARGGGKSELLSMIPLMYCDDRYFRGIFFRRKYDEIMGANGLWQKAENMYPLFNAVPKISDKAWVWKSKARQEFRHMYAESDKSSHKGKGYSFIGFDEIDHFSKDQVTYLMRCLRSEANMDSFCVGTLNPNPDSWCLSLVKYYLDEDGLPREDRCGDIRWFIVKDGDFIFGDSEEYFQENYASSVYVNVPNKEEKVYIRPKRFTYMFFNVFDNPALIRDNPTYLSELQNQPEHLRLSELYGNWFSRPRSQSLWQRHWVRGEKGEKVKSYKDLPTDIKWFRGWDKAYSEPSETNKYPDYTAASPKIGKDSLGQYWLIGDYDPNILDNCELEKEVLDERVLGRFRKLTGERDNLIITQALHDGDDATVVLTKDSGGGATDHTFTKGRLIAEGIKVYEDKSPKNTKGKKLRDIQPFINASQTGMVFIIEESFNPATLKKYYSELERFDGERSTPTKKDDWCDATALAFSAATSVRVVPIVRRQQTQHTTDANSLLASKQR